MKYRKVSSTVGYSLLLLRFSVSRPCHVWDTVFDQVIEHYGTCDVLVNNAGITKDTLVMRMKPAQWQAVIDVNLSGTFSCIQEFVKHVEGNARIINMASVVGQIGNPGQANYAASKGGVIGLTRSCAKEFSKRNIKGTQREKRCEIVLKVRNLSFVNFRCASGSQLHMPRLHCQSNDGQA